MQVLHSASDAILHLCWTAFLGGLRSIWKNYFTVSWEETT